MLQKFMTFMQGCMHEHGKLQRIQKRAKGGLGGVNDKIEYRGRGTKKRDKNSDNHAFIN